MVMVTLGSLLVTLLVVAFLFCAVLMMLVILIQKPKGGGLGGAFGGAGGGGGGGMENAAFGTKTGDVLTGLTVVLFVFFMGLGISLVFAVRADVTGEVMPQQDTIGDGGPRTSTDDQDDQDRPIRQDPTDPLDDPDDPDNQDADQDADVQLELDEDPAQP